MKTSKNRYCIPIAFLLILFPAIVNSQTMQDSINSQLRETSNTYVTVEQMPSFPGGETEMHKFINEHFQIPSISEEEGTQGRVGVRFIVTQTGEIRDIKAITYPQTKITESFIEMIKKMPKWIPGKQNGETVDVYYTLSMFICLRSR